jgi:hypothetical protein
MNRFLAVPAMALCFFALLTSEDVLATELKQHLLTAIDAPTGKSEGELSGSMADFFKAQTRSSLPVRVQVKTIKRFSSAGCVRLEATLLQEGVPATNGQTIPFAIRYELNLCRDGRPPTEGMDLGQASRALSRDPSPQ